jgi:pSer/pThr/pTyr-binding forkhead associated (FHA) protein
LEAVVVLFDWLMQTNSWIVVGALGGIIIALLGILLALIFRSRKRRVAPHKKQSEPPTVPVKPSSSTASMQLILPNRKAIPLNHFPLSIGRDSENDIVLDSKAVSAIHARLYFDAASGKVYIEDNDSRNGILLNGYPTRKNILSNGDTITLGNVTITFQVLA